MTDEVTDLKAELTELSLKCQLARDNEVRYALQRSRLETERAQLLVRIMGAQAAVAPAATLPQAVHHEIIRASSPAGLAAVGTADTVVVTDTAGDDGRHKPTGLPSIPILVQLVLRDAPNGLRPCEISAVMRDRWWPGVTSRQIAPIIWHMGQKGHLVKDGSMYRLNGHGHRKA